MKTGTLRAALCGVVVAGLMVVGCSGGDNYDEFSSAVESGASCAELFDQRANFDKRSDLDRIDADLEQIGCETRNSERTDR
jgi:outer membrane murein-binding lipoprotein Lpp